VTLAGKKKFQTSYQKFPERLGYSKYKHYLKEVDSAAGIPFSPSPISNH
jgi:hypothetical protein